MTSKNSTRRLSIFNRDADDTVHSITTTEALIKWEEERGESARQAKVIMLNGHYPPIHIMDHSLGKLIRCEKLSLSTNMIERIANLNGLKHLKILSLGRNLITSLAPLEVVSDTLEELWISYNSIQKFDGILTMKKLRVLYMSNNHIKEWSELRRLSAISTLEDLVFNGNPLHDEWKKDEESWIDTVHKLIKSLRKLDGLFL
ncbi:unnamed protein product [Adineta steineri]|uniref:Dynein axonemal light chain 1 n=1 Tax=Adineta steineri TaxID=433720 RepID=A0A818P5R7_9BILA|nr:unnamed protein product [Adineta steineri]CAF3618635.1 unnamed protein product [Adineta steineri]